MLNDLPESLTAGGKLKEADTKYWESPNSGSTNESRFRALPGGFRYISGSYIETKSTGRFWSSTETTYEGTDMAIYRYLFYGSAHAIRNFGYKQEGFSVRCLKD